MKKKLRKPHELLQDALALFGPKGEYWMKGDYHKTIEGGFYPREAVITANHEAIQREDLASEIAELLYEKTPEQTIKIINKKYVHRDEVQTFCAIGAVNKINTVNENLAVEYLATAIDPKQVKELKAQYGDAYAQSHYYDGIITSNNDKVSTKFPKVRGWFKKAIALAKKAGD